MFHRLTAHEGALPLVGSGPPASQFCALGLHPCGQHCASFSKPQSNPHLRRFPLSPVCLPWSEAEPGVGANTPCCSFSSAGWSRLSCKELLPPVPEWGLQPGKREAEVCVWPPPSAHPPSPLCQGILTLIQSALQSFAWTVPFQLGGAGLRVRPAAT